MKNLFYLCLVAILSLGSTGFTTVEEMDGSNSENPPGANCFDMAMVIYNIAFYHSGGNHEAAGQSADIAYDACVDDGGSPGSQEPVVIISD